MKISNSKTVTSHQSQGWHLVRIAVACLLLTASALKCWQLATEPVMETSVLDSRWLLIVTVEFELILGLWLLANIWAKPSWAAALACFGLFTCVSLYKALSGHTSCGCFGRVSVNPWYTGTLDVVVFCSLLQWRPKESLFTVGRAFSVLLIWLLIGIPAGYAMSTYQPTTLSEAGSVIGNGKVVVLKPEKWVGKRLPLLDYIDIGNSLKKGRWLVLLYHFGCPKCQQIMKDLPTVADRTAREHIAIVEMPPYTSSSTERLVNIASYKGRLTDKHEWFAATPLVLILSDGNVDGIHQQ